MKNRAYTIKSIDNFLEKELRKLHKINERLMNNLKGKILETTIIENTQGGLFAKVQTVGGQIIDDVLLLYPPNTTSRPQIGDADSDTNLVLLLKSSTDDNIYGLPYNILLQPSLEVSEYIAGNFVKGSKIFFDKDGNVIIATANGNTIIINDEGDIEIMGSSKIVINGSAIEIGGAVSPALNKLASMTVTVPGGSSAGTYPVLIVTSGQTADKTKV